MSFTSHNGTRGTRQPPNGALMRWAKKRWINRIERTSGKVMGRNVLVLTTVGKKTGMERRTPVGWFPAPAGTWFVVASASGAAKNPAWYYNLAASPTKARITMGGRDSSSDGEAITRRSSVARSASARGSHFFLVVAREL